MDLSPVAFDPLPAAVVKDPNALVDDPIAEENSPELSVPSVLICAFIQNDIVNAIRLNIFFMLVVFCVFLHVFC